jgi:hypothetical protein
VLQFLTLVGECASSGPFPDPPVELEADRGPVKGMQMVVEDINAARAELVERGVGVSEVTLRRADPDLGGRLPRHVRSR